jgi:hypothetical protein
VFRSALLASAFVAGIAGGARAQSAPVQAGIWQLTQADATACIITGVSGNNVLSLGVGNPNPTIFGMNLGPLPPSQPGSPVVATLYYGAGQPQTLTGQISSDGKNAGFILSGDPTTNNFATFLHGFTAGTELSVVINGTAIDFNLAGTSAIIGALGHCTVAADWTGLPYPWHSPTPEESIEAADADAGADARNIAAELSTTPTLPATDNDGVSVVPSFQPTPTAPNTVPTPADDPVSTWHVEMTGLEAARACGLITHPQFDSAAIGFMLANHFIDNQGNMSPYVPANIKEVSHDAIAAGDELAGRPGFCNNYPPDALNIIRELAADNQ